MLPEINKLPSFYKEMALAFAYSNVCPKPDTREDVLNMPLWGNRFIFYENKDCPKRALYFSSFYKAGIRNVMVLSHRAG